MKKEKCFLQTSYLIWVLCLLFSIALSACGPVTPVPMPPTPTPLHSDLDVISSQNVNQLKQVETWGKGKLYSAQLSNDGAWVGVYTPLGIYLYDTEIYQERLLIEPGKNQTFKPGALAFKPDGSELAYGSDQVLFWNLKENRGQYTRQIQNRGSNSRIAEIQYSPNGKYLFVKSKLGNIASCEGPTENYALYEIETDKVLFDKTYCAYGGNNYFRFTADNKLYLFFALDEISGQPSSILVIETSTGRLIQEIKYDYLPNEQEPAEKIKDVSPNGAVFAAMKVKFDDTETTYSSRLMDSKSQVIGNSDVNGIIIFTTNENRRWVIKGNYDYSSKEKRVYEMQDGAGKVLCSFDAANAPYSQKISSDGDIVLSQVSNSEILLWKVSTCKKLKSFYFPDSDEELTFTPQEKKLITTNPWTIYVWDGVTGQYKYTVPVLSVIGNSPPFDVSEDGASLFTLHEYSDKDDKLKYEFVQIDLETGAFVKTFGQGDVWTRSVEVSPFGTLATVRAYASANYFELWDIATGRQVISIEDNKYLDAVYNQDKSKAALGELFSVLIVDLKTGAILRTIDVPSPQFMSFLPDSSLVVGTYDEGLKKYVLYKVENVDDANSRITKIGESDCALPITASGNHIACMLKDDRLQIGDLTDSGKYQTLMGHSQLGQDAPSWNRTSVMFNPAGNMLLSWRNEYIVSGGGNMWQGTLRFWNVSTGQFIGEIQTDYRIESIKFNSDGRLLAATGSDGLIRLWGVPHQP